MADTERKNKLSLQVILSNEKLLAVISFVLAFIAWLSISLSEAPEIERVIENVKVTIDDSVPKQLGYETFGIDDVYVDITVKGKRYLVGDNVLSADDFTVTAITTHVDSPGNYSLQLKATANDPGADYTIVSKSMDNIEVYFDTPRTVEIPVEAKVNCDSEKLLYSDEYSTEDAIPSLKKVSVTGPSTEIEKMRHAIASVETNGRLRKTETIPAELFITDAYGAEIRYIEVNNAPEDLSVTIPVYKSVELPVTVSFLNAPIYYIDNPPKVVCAPDKVGFKVDM